MKNIFIISYTLLLASCFNFEPLESNIIFKNSCPNKIEVYGGNNIYPHKFTLEEGESMGFSGIDTPSKDNSKFFISNGKRNNFFISPDSHEYNQILIACPENTKSTGNKNWLTRKSKKI